MVKQGNTAPDFTLETDKGAQVTLSQLRGKQYFAGVRYRPGVRF